MIDPRSLPQTTPAEPAPAPIDPAAMQAFFNARTNAEAERLAPWNQPAKPDTSVEAQVAQDVATKLPSNITAFREDAANTNDPPVYLGRYMLFSDQDMVAIKHNLIGNTIISTVFVGLLGTIENPAIPLPMRMLLVAILVTGAHAVFVGLWNLIQSLWQLHPALSPSGLWAFVKAKNLRLLSFGFIGFKLVEAFAPSVAQAIDNTRRVFGL